MNESMRKYMRVGLIHFMAMVGVKDTFGESGCPEELAVKYGLTADGIVVAVKEVLTRK
ncbi:MAG: transketolase [Anaerosporomusa subterranea]|jgi:transketolase|nr:transketolase [Anaerosporomusa subterranea]